MVFWPPRASWAPRKGACAFLKTFSRKLHISGLAQQRIAAPDNFHSGPAVILLLHLAKVPGPGAGLGLIAAQ